MKKTIERLRAKPRKERRRVAFGGAFIVTLLITLVWLSVVVNDFSSSSQTAQVEGPISSIKSFVGDVFNKL